MRLRPLRRQDGHARPAPWRFRRPRIVACAIVATLGGAVLSPAALAADSPPAGDTINVQRAQRLDGHTVVLGSAPVVVRGTVSAYRSGSRATVVLTRAGLTVEVVRAPVTPSGYGTGRFEAVLRRVSAGGELTVSLHGTTLATATVLAASADLGASGPQVRFLQRRLFDERYAVPLSGFFDAATGRAVVAFRKVNDLPRVTYASPEVMSMLAAGRGAYRVRYRHQGRHAEGDLTHQVLALVHADGGLWRVYETSSGRPTLPTPIGRFRIYRQEYGLNSHDELDMSYFKGICGIHGYFVVPTHADSHCCLRVPLANALAVRDFLHVGDAVLTFRRSRAAASRLG